MHGPSVTRLLESMKRVQKSLDSCEASYVEQLVKVQTNPNDFAALLLLRAMEDQLQEAVETFNAGVIFIHELAAVN